MRRVVTLLLFIAVSACGGGDPTNPGGNGVTNFTAKIDGADWNAEYAPSAVNNSAGLYVITALRVTGSNNYSLIFTLANITGTGTYPLGVGLQMFGGSALISQPGADGWSTPLSGVAGQIVITTLSATQMVGTFQFVATPLLGAGASKTVTQGTFDIPVTGAGGLAALNQGSSVTGTVGGTFVAAAATMLLTTGGTDNLTIVGQNDVRTVTIGVANMTGPNTYGVSTSVPIRSIQVGGEPGDPLASWTSQLGGGSGSIVISTVTAQRITGSFTGTLVPANANATGNLTVSGTFSLGRP